jgi:hypothetical protein
MKAVPQQPRPFVPYQPPKQLMDAHAKAMDYQRIKGFTEQNKHLVVTCSVSSTQSYTVGK